MTRIVLGMTLFALTAGTVSAQYPHHAPYHNHLDCPAYDYHDHPVYDYYNCSLHGHDSVGSHCQGCATYRAETLDPISPRCQRAIRAPIHCPYGRADRDPTALAPSDCPFGREIPESYGHSHGDHSHDGHSHGDPKYANPDHGQPEGAPRIDEPYPNPVPGSPNAERSPASPRQQPDADLPPMSPDGGVPPNAPVESEDGGNLPPTTLPIR